MHGSRRLLLLLALTILLPGVILAGVGFRALLQERQSAEQEWRQRRDRVAVQVSQTLQRDVDTWLADIGRVVASAARDAALLPEPVRRALVTPGVAVVLVGASGDVWPPQALAYRQWRTPPPAIPDAFRAAEDLEVAGEDLVRVVARYQELLASASGNDRAWLLHRLARSQRKAGHHAAAARSLIDLERMSGAFVQELPAEFLARYERCAPANRLPCTQADALQIYRDLATGRWLLEEARYRAYVAEIREWIAEARSVSALTEIDALKARRDALTDAVHGFAAGRRASDYLVLQGSGAGSASRGTALFLDRAWLADHLQATVLTGASTAGFIATVRIDGEDVPVVGSAKPADEGLLRTLPVTTGGLVWHVDVWPENPVELTREVQRRQRTYFILIVGLVALLGSGTYLTLRVVRRETEIARMKSDFVAAVSHEFRSPVTGIRQLAEMLMRGRVPSEARRQEYYERLTQESDRLARTLENLLDFSRMEEGRRPYRFETTDPREWLTHTIASFMAGSGRGSHRVITDMADPLPPVRIDREALGNAVENLLDNAVKYSPGADAVWVHVTADGATVTIRVRDRGVGIPAADHPRVFDRFYRAAQGDGAQVPGTGLGLSLVRHIVQAHGGRVALESQPGAGTTVSIQLRAEG